MPRRSTRRQALQTAGVTLATALAGCLREGVRRTETLQPDAGEPGDAFGWDVALTSRWTLVGAPAAGDRRQGVAYLYDADTAGHRRLTPAADAGEFGGAVAVDAGTLAVGAPATSDPGIEGSVTVFTSDGDQWRREARLVAPDTAGNERFGYDVALSGTRLVVGARATDVDGATDAGVAHVYERADGRWTHRTTLARRDAAAYAYTGGSVALDSGTALLGSFLADAAATDSGVATVFKRLDGWDQRATLRAPDAEPGDRFGNAVALDGDCALIGAVGRGGGPDAAADRGGAYVFARSESDWTHRTTLPAPADPEAAFGVAVALDGERALVGAFSATGAGPGRAVLFKRGGDGWRKRTTLRPADGDPGDGFGSAVALAGSRAVVGAVSDGAEGAGTATLFGL